MRILNIFATAVQTSRRQYYTLRVSLGLIPGQGGQGTLCGVCMLWLRGFPLSVLISSHHKDMHARNSAPASDLDQGDGKKPGVGPRALVMMAAHFSKFMCVCVCVCTHWC